MAASAYVSNRRADDLSGLTAKLAADLRENIRGFAAAPPFSPPWVSVARRIASVATIVETERQLALAGGGAKADGTLWEGEEWALRFLLEEGKINVSVRIGEEYVRARSEAFLEGTAGTGTGSGSGAGAGAGEAGASDGKSSGDEGEDEAVCLDLERSLATVLSTAWAHREAAQVTEAPLAVSLLKGAMAAARAAPSTDSRACVSMTNFALRLWHSLGSCMLAAVGETKLVPDMVRRDVFGPELFAFILHRALACKGVENKTLLEGLAGMAAVMAGEEFSSAKGKLLSAHALVPLPPARGSGAGAGAGAGAIPPTFAAAGAEIKAALTSRFLSGSDTSARRQLRSLLDFVDAAGRRK
jgi:hypothetical protein